MMLTINAAGLDIIKQCEGCRLDAYQDVGGVWTIGFGHTGNDVSEGMTITQEQADAFLQNDLVDTENAVSDVVTYPGLTDNQFSALVSLVYNIGIGNFERSTLLSLLNGGYPKMAATHILLWNKVNGQESDGLMHRRRLEYNLFTTP